MNKKIKTFALLLFLIINGTAYSQRLSSIAINGKQVKPLDQSYSFSDTLIKIFYKENGKHIWDLRKNVRKLNFDHCNHSIEMFLYVDSTGQISYTQIVSGTNLPKVDSLIISKVDSLDGKIGGVTFEGKKMRAIIPLRLKYYSYEREQTMDRLGIYNFINIIYVHDNLDESRAIRKITECDNDLYFYNEGIKSYEAGDFSSAMYNFKQAIKENENDFDAIYNLGLCYQKKDKLKNACECFSQAAAAGDESSIKALGQYCSQINNK